MTSGPPDWESAYGSATPPPWDIGGPQSAFVRLADRGLLAGRVLDAALPGSMRRFYARAVTFDRPRSGIALRPEANPIASLISAARGGSQRA